MAHDAAPDRWRTPGDPPAEVQVIVMPAPRSRVRRGRPSRAQTLHRGLLMAAVALAVAGAAAIAVGVAGGPAARSPTRNTAGQMGPPAVAAAYRFPLGCLSLTISRRHADYPRGHLDRASPCWRYGVYLTAVLRRVRGEWRLALEADSASCPVVSLPAAVRTQVAICTRVRVPGTRAQ